MMPATLPASCQTISRRSTSATTGITPSIGSSSPDPGAGDAGTWHPTSCPYSPCTVGDDAAKKAYAELALNHTAKAAALQQDMLQACGLSLESVQAAL